MQTTLYINFQTLKGSLLRSQYLDLAELLTHLSFYGWPPYKQELRRSNQKMKMLKCHLLSQHLSRRSRAGNSRVCGQMRPKLALIHDFIVVLLTCKNEEDPIKTEGARVLTKLYIDFSDAQGQITLQSVVKSRRN